MIVALAVSVSSTGVLGSTRAAPGLSHAAYAEGEVDGIGSSVTRVRRGETFDVSVNVPAVSAYADTVQVRIEFDPNAFEATSWNPNVGSGTALPNCDNINGFVAYVSAFANVDLSRGLTITARFKTKNAAALGNHNFELKMVDVSNTDTGYSWTPRTLTLPIKVVDRLIPISGHLSLKASDTFTGTATIKLTDSKGNVQNTTVEFLKNDVTGLFEGEYRFDGGETDETYTLQISMPGCKTRTETINATRNNFTSNLSVNLFGDVDGNGRLSAADATHILKYVVGLPCSIKNENGVVDEYLFSVARVGGGATLTERDATQILRHLAGFTSVFDNIS